MDIRTLEYFLAVAQEGNITKAAKRLHITQPTLSRQLMELEEELDVQLFLRGKRQITLTDNGVLFQQRAREMVSLMDKTKRDLSEQVAHVAGVVSMGCVESSASRWIAEVIGSFASHHPGVQFDMYSADGDDIREKLDRGDIDVGVLLEPIEAAKYDSIRLPVVETWGLLMRRDDPLAQSQALTVEEIGRLPLILPRRSIVQEAIISWIGLEPDALRVVARHNLLTNSMALVEQKLGYVICVGGAYAIRETGMFRFVPILPEHPAGHMLAWKKNRVFSTATARFIQCVKEMATGEMDAE